MARILHRSGRRVTQSVPVVVVTTGPSVAVVPAAPVVVTATGSLAFSLPAQSSLIALLEDI